MQCTSPIRITKYSASSSGFLVPCGKCLGCRISRRKEWSLRMLHELSSHDKNVFITLTYDEKNIPENASLKKHHLQLFFKRLRRDLDHQDRKIKYFACGEYGDQTFRPHYHAIIFGLGLEYDDKLQVIENWRFCDWQNPLILKKSFGVAEPDSIRYVAQYIDKKYTGDLAETEYTLKNREPVFKLSSNGIGRKYAEENAQQIEQQGLITLNGVKHRIPRYYLHRIGIDPKEYKKRSMESDLNMVEKFTGERITSEEYYRTKSKDEILKFEDLKKMHYTQKKRNLQAKVNLKPKKL